jgi:predicted amidohydrolase
VAVVGGTVERRDHRGRITNTCFVHDASGAVIARYDKRMLFGGERDGRSAGDGTTVFDIAGVRIGVLICADLWHPELARELRARVDVLAVPAKTTVESAEAMRYARALWHGLALTRGMESGFAVVVSDWAAGPQENLVDASRPVKLTSGATTIVDPSSRPVIERVQRTIDSGGAGSIVATIETVGLQAYRAYRARVGLLPGAETA